MNFKYPKSITVAEIKFKIIYDYKSQEGASFSFPHEGKEAFVKFGMKNHKANPLSFLDYVIHEFKEIIQTGQSSRYYNNGSDDFEFHYNHKQHQDLCGQLAGILDKFIK